MALAQSLFNVYTNLPFTVLYNVIPGTPVAFIRINMAQFIQDLWCLLGIKCDLGLIWRYVASAEKWGLVQFSRKGWEWYDSDDHGVRRGTMEVQWGLRNAVCGQSPHCGMTLVASHHSSTHTASATKGYWVSTTTQSLSPHTQCHCHWHLTP